MSISDSAYRSAAPEDGADMANGRSRETIYRVVLEGIKREIETTDSFAIKYGILTSTPVTKIKFMLRNLPKTILETKSAEKARGALGLIDEAGGVGLVEDYNPEEAPKVEIAEEEPVIANTGKKNCIKCGFPLKESDRFCRFCHTPLVETRGKKKNTIMKARGKRRLVSPKMLVICCALLLLVLLWGILAR